MDSMQMGMPGASTFQVTMEDVTKHILLSFATVDFSSCMSPANAIFQMNAV